MPSLRVTSFLISIRKKLYVYVALMLLLGFLTGLYYRPSRSTLRFVGFLSVFVMLYPMLIGIEVSKVIEAVKRPWFVALSISYAFGVASLTAYVISHTLLKSYPEVAFALAMVGVIPCSNMLIGWSGIAEASVEDAMVVAVTGLLLIPFISPLLLSVIGGIFVSFSILKLLSVLLIYILAPLALSYGTRYYVVKNYGMKAFMKLKRYLPSVAALGVLLIVFTATARASPMIETDPEVLLLVTAGLLSYYVIQTFLALIAIRILKLRYELAVVFLFSSVASSQAISLSVAATMFPTLTVFALSLKPMLQVLYIVLLLYTVVPFLLKSN